ncbi:putative transposase [Colletotrichum karsti]|uniref:Transposase n=1 Tax=Colletotrichum karsti TaxID=1095194 RepID=A0A9P6HSH8_9PEZI|nr:putative transposase [Colletotrichum karsti]KAF9869209.1 putative transposase [Colletotrichum karsti]
MNITNKAIGIAHDARADKTVFSPASTSASAPLSASASSLSRHARCISTLACSHWTPDKVWAVQAILKSSSASLVLTRQRLLFRFESHEIPLPCAVFSRPAPRPATTAPAKATSTIPCLAYIHYADVCIARRNSLKYICSPRPPRRAMSIATASLYGLRLDRIIPDDPHEDPYIAALLIALAQSNRRALARVRPQSSPESYRVHVLRTDPTTELYLTLYAADIPATLLRKLSDFNESSGMRSEFSISSKRIPFEPYSSFQERLHNSITPRTSKRRRAAEDVDPRDSTRQRTR